MFQAGSIRNGNSGSGSLSGEERFVRLKKEIHKQLITGLNLPSIGAVDDYECDASSAEASSSFAPIGRS